jgi:hypothetical protein
MFQAASEGGQAVSGTAAFFVIVGVIWVANRRERRRAKQAARAKRKAEIQAIVASRPEDADLFREVLDDLDADDDKDGT